MLEPVYFYNDQLDLRVVLDAAPKKQRSRSKKKSHADGHKTKAINPPRPTPFRITASKLKHDYKEYFLTLTIGVLNWIFDEVISKYYITTKTFRS